MTDYSFLHNEEILKTLKNIEKQSGIPEDLAKKIQVMKGDAGKDGSSITAIETKDIDDSVEIKVSFTDRDPQSFTVQKLKGLDGTDGTDGSDGYTPVKGKDYFDGEPGAPGKKGDPGRPGKPGTDGKDGKSITWRGVWNSNNSYSVQDTVEYNGSSYIAVNPNKGTLPTGTDWDLLAQKGRDGISRGASVTTSPSSSGGITRSVSTNTTSTTIGSTASTDYITFIDTGGAPTLPTAVGNSNRYTFKNISGTNKTLSTTSSQTIDGSTTATLTPNTSLDVVSDGSNWRII